MPGGSLPGCRSDVCLNRLGFTPCSHRLCAAHTNVRAHKSRCTCTHWLAPRTRSPEPSQRRIRPYARLMCAAHVHAQPHNCKLHVRKLVLTVQGAGLHLQQENPSLRQSDVRRTRCISPAHIGSHGARASHDTGACSGSLAGGECRAQEALWRVPGASFTAA